QVKLTLTNLSKETSLHIACKYNRTDVLQLLIHYHMDLEARDNRGYTPLLTASYFNHQDCIRILLINRADITAVDNYGKNIRKYYFKPVVDLGILEGGGAIYRRERQGCPQAEKIGVVENF